MAFDSSIGLFSRVMELVDRHHVPSGADRRVFFYELIELFRRQDRETAGDCNVDSVGDPGGIDPDLDTVFDARILNTAAEFMSKSQRPLTQADHLRLCAESGWSPERIQRAHETAVLLKLRHYNKLTSGDLPPKGTE